MSPYHVDDPEVVDESRGAYSGHLFTRNAPGCLPTATPTRISRVQKATGDGANGVWTATPFMSVFSPEDLFPATKCIIPFDDQATRFVFTPQPIIAGSQHGYKTMAIYTDGACSDNGAPVNNNGNGRAPRGGCAFVFEPWDGTVCFALEDKGQDNACYAHTSNRAELRAALAALRYRRWAKEGWECVVVITDSQYVGMNVWYRLRKWAERGWISSKNEPVKNQDLWKALSKRIGEMAAEGCEVMFWSVSRKWNGAADAAAKAAAYKSRSLPDPQF